MVPGYCKTNVKKGDGIKVNPMGAHPENKKTCHKVQCCIHNQYWFSLKPVTNKITYLLNFLTKCLLASNNVLI